VTGELTIRGVTRSVAARGTYQPPTEDPFGTYRAGLELRATVDRRQWAMTERWSTSGAAAWDRPDRPPGTRSACPGLSDGEPSVDGYGRADLHNRGLPRSRPDPRVRASRVVDGFGREGSSGRAPNPRRQVPVYAAVSALQRAGVRPYVRLTGGSCGSGRRSRHEGGPGKRPSGLDRRAGEREAAHRPIPVGARPDGTPKCREREAVGPCDPFEHRGGSLLVCVSGGVVARDLDGSEVDRERTRLGAAAEPADDIGDRGGTRGQARVTAVAKIPQTEGIRRGRVTACGRACSRWCSLSLPFYGFRGARVAAPAFRRQMSSPASRSLSGA
jgi:hypothetical protein